MSLPSPIRLRRRAGIAGSGERVRRDPRRESDPNTDLAMQGQAEWMGPNGRIRRNPRLGRRAATPVALAVAAVKAVPVLVLEAPKWFVLVVPDLDGGRLSSHDRDVLGAARVLADNDADHGTGAVIALVHGLCLDDLAEAGVDRVQTFEALPTQYAPELRAAAVLATMAAWRPRHVLWPESPSAGGDVGRRVAAATGIWPAARVMRVAAREVASRIRGGASDLLRAPPQLLFVSAEAAEPAKGPRREARPLPPLAVPLRPVSIVDAGLLPADPQNLALTEADFIVSAGNGVSDWAVFHTLSKALGATPGGSRAVCDAGHLPRSRQVGASGSLVEPRCYLALGIAGAPQHLAGITRCERVIAVNTDLHADMVKRADLSIIADAQLVMPALISLLRKVQVNTEGTNSHGS